MKHTTVFLLLTFSVSTIAAQTRPDTAIDGIKLDDYESTERILGKNIGNKRFEFRGHELPEIEIVNKARHQVLRLYFGYGGTLNSVLQFELLTIDSTYKFPKLAVFNNRLNFVSSKKISLGMSKAAVLKILGNNYTSKNKQRLVFTINEPSAFLKRYNMGGYFINCDFVNDKLVKYKFGFDNE